MWFTETPWPPILLCSVLAVFALAGWYANRRVVYLLGTVLLAVLAAGIFFIEQLILTERERVEAAVFGLTSAFQHKDRTATLGFFSERATVERRLAEAGLRAVDVSDDLRVSDVQIEMLSNNTRAISHFRANATVSYAGSSQNLGWQPSRWRLTWQLEAGEWKVVRVEHLNVTSGQEQPVPISY